MIWGSTVRVGSGLVGGRQSGENWDNYNIITIKKIFKTKNIGVKKHGWTFSGQIRIYLLIHASCTPKEKKKLSIEQYIIFFLCILNIPEISKNVS